MTGYVIYYEPGQQFVTSFNVSGNGLDFQCSWTDTEDVARAPVFAEAEAHAIAGILRVRDPLYAGPADDRDIFKVLSQIEAAKL